MNLATVGTFGPWSTSDAEAAVAGRGGRGSTALCRSTSASAPSAAVRCRRRSRWRRSCRCSRCSSCSSPWSASCPPGDADFTSDVISDLGLQGEAAADRRGRHRHRRGQPPGRVDHRARRPAVGRARRGRRRCRRRSTPPGRSRAAGCSTGSSRSRWLLGAGTLFLATRRARPRARLAPGPARGRQHRARRRAHHRAVPLDLRVARQQPRRLAGAPARRAARGGRLRGPQGRRRRVRAARGRRARPRSTARSASCSPRSRGSRLRAAHRATAPCSTSCATRPPPARSPWRSRCPASRARCRSPPTAAGRWRSGPRAPGLVIGT